MGPIYFVWKDTCKREKNEDVLTKFSHNPYVEVSHSVLLHGNVELSSKILCKKKIVDLETSFPQVFNLDSSNLRKMSFLLISLTLRWHYGYFL